MPRHAIAVDPGFDLGKTWRQSLRVLAAMDRFASLGYPVMLAASNRIFLLRALRLEKHQRRHATLAACDFALTKGTRVLRVHEVLPPRHAADLLKQLLGDE